MKQWYFLLLAVVAAQLSACNKEIDYITSIEPMDNAFLVEVDTFTAVSETFIPDSISTSSGLTYFKLGTLTDAVYGKVKCNPVFRMSLPLTDPELTNSSYFDSMEMVIVPTRSYMGDTSVPLQINAYRLSQDLSNTDNIFYAHHRFDTYSTPIGSGSFRYRPAQLGKDSIRLSLDKQLGEELFNMIRKKDALVTDASQFANWFKGIRLSAVSNGANMMMELPKTDSAIMMRVYYHNDEGRPVAQSFNFLLNASVYGYFEMDIDRNGTPLAGLTAAKPIVQSGPNALYYQQTLTNLQTRFYFPYLKEVMKTATYSQILSATLELKPMQNNLVQFPLPPSLSLYYYSIDGYEDGPAVDGLNNEMDGDLVLDAFQGKNTAYTFDVAAYTKAELTANTFTSRKLLLKSGSTDSELYQLTAGIPGNTSYASRLIITYLTYTK